MESIVANNKKNQCKIIQKATTFHGISSQQSPKRKRRKSKISKKDGKKKRNSILKPSIYQKIQKKRRSQIIDNTISSKDEINNISKLRVKVDYRRTVFVSLKGFYECWRLIPPHVLFDAILILPLYREWIISPLKYKHEFNDILNDSKFVTLLQWKDKQGLIFFMLNAINSKVILEHRIKNQNNMDNNIAPFWYYLSDKLQSLYDPDTCDSYRPLLLNERWWKYAYSNKGDKTCCLYYSRYNVSTEEILNELWFLTMKFKTISEILFQSNPSLNVVISCDDLNNKSLLHSKSAYSSPLNNNLSSSSIPSTSSSISVYNSPSTQYILPSNSMNSPITPPSFNCNINHTLPQQILAIKSILSEDFKIDDNYHNNNQILKQCDENVAVSININATNLDNMDNNYLSTCDTFIQSSPSINRKYNIIDDDDDDVDEDDMESSSNMISKITENSKIMTVVNSGSDFDDEINDHLLNYKDKASSSEESACSSAMFATMNNNNKRPSIILSNNDDDDEDDDEFMSYLVNKQKEKEQEQELEREEAEFALKKKENNNDMIKSVSPSPSPSSNSNSNDSNDSDNSNNNNNSTNDNMDWWVCPDYYYDTYKNKIDTDCDTDY